MIKGPKRTPYEDGLFFFDFQFPADYPKVPPLCHYISYCSDRLNPNLYEGGKVCVSLLGTWGGKVIFVWEYYLSSVIYAIIDVSSTELIFFNATLQCIVSFKMHSKICLKQVYDFLLLKLLLKYSNLLLYCSCKCVALIQVLRMCMSYSLCLMTFITLDNWIHHALMWFSIMIQQTCSSGMIWESIVYIKCNVLFLMCNFIFQNH